MFKIGLRTIKSAIAVFICFNISYYILKDGYPFYSAIAALLCMQPDIQNSLKTGINRIEGTLIGGLFGIIILATCHQLFSYNMMLYYTLITIAIIPLIHTTVLINKKNATYISCVVFLSIVVSHGKDISPYYFGLIRIIETCIGIVVSLIINSFNPLVKPPNSILFVSDLDGTLLNSNKIISKYTQTTLNTLISKGLMFSIATARTPATITEILQNIQINLPVICMNGSAIYDLSEKKYLYYSTIQEEISEEIVSVINSNNLNCFIHTIEDNHLYIYYNSLKNNAEIEFYNERKDLKLKTYINTNNYKNRPIIFIMVLDETREIETIYNQLKNSYYYNKLTISKYEDIYNKGYYYLEIYSNKASKSNGVEYLKNYSKTDTIVAFGDNNNDIPMLQNADISCAVENAVPQVANRIIPSNDKNVVAKTIKTMI